jgi:hypothetical protein
MVDVLYSRQRIINTGRQISDGRERHWRDRYVERDR